MKKCKLGTALVAAALTVSMVFQSAAGVQASKDYDKYSNSKNGWGLSLNKEHKTPANYTSKKFKGKRAYYYVKNKQKKIYLTFDCGYENGNTKKILKTLKKQNIKAIFFVTKPYIAENPGLVKQMKKEGHLVGNHTVNHPSLPSLSVTKVKKELKDCEKYMKKKTGYDMDHFMRPPMGEWSPRVLEAIKDLGYSTIFWSMAFYDYDVKNQPGAAKITDQFMTNYHKGAIVLFHVISKSDTDALNGIITTMKNKKYQFGSLTELATKKTKLQVLVKDKKENGKAAKVRVYCNRIHGKYQYTYYDKNGNVLAKAPTKAGAYSVNVSIKATNVYQAAQSGKVKYKISKK